MDLISRQAAIDALAMWDMQTVDGITASTVLKQVRTDILNLPSAEPTQNNTSNALESLDCISRRRLHGCRCQNVNDKNMKEGLTDDGNDKETGTAD